MDPTLWTILEQIGELTARYGLPIVISIVVIILGIDKYLFEKKETKVFHSKLTKAVICIKESVSHISESLVGMDKRLEEIEDFNERHEILCSNFRREDPSDA